MKKVELKKGEKVQTIVLPTSLDEISDEYLLALANNIKIADDYSLVGIVYHETLNRIVMSYKTGKKNIKTGVIPIFIKAGKTDVDFIKEAKLKEKLVISSAQLELSYHVNLPGNILNIDRIMSKIVEDLPMTEYQKLIQDVDPTHVYFVEFKLVPDVDIIALHKNNVNLEEIPEPISK